MITVGKGPAGILSTRRLCTEKHLPHGRQLNASGLFCRLGARRSLGERPRLQLFGRMCAPSVSRRDKTAHHRLKESRRKGNRPLGRSSSCPRSSQTLSNCRTRGAAFGNGLIARKPTRGVEARIGLTLPRKRAAVIVQGVSLHEFDLTDPPLNWTEIDPTVEELQAERRQLEARCIRLGRP
jgi:hypothetical protein